MRRLTSTISTDEAGALGRCRRRNGRLLPSPICEQPASDVRTESRADPVAVSDGAIQLPALRHAPGGAAYRSRTIGARILDLEMHKSAAISIRMRSTRVFETQAPEQQPACDVIGKG